MAKSRSRSRSRKANSRSTKSASIKMNPLVVQRLLFWGLIIFSIMRSEFLIRSLGWEILLISPLQWFDIPCLIITLIAFNFVARNYLFPVVRRLITVV